MEDNFNKLTIKFQEDHEFAEKLLNMETQEEAQALLKGAGLDFSIEEILELRDGIIKLNELSENCELTEEELENIAGGKSITYNPFFPGGYKDYPWPTHPFKAYTDGVSIAVNSIDYVRRIRIPVPRRW